jgi:hydrogenase nickel incorporation protein HypB
MQVPIVENVLKLNDEVASINRQLLRDAGVYTVDLIGAPGCGKTALLEATIQQLAGKLSIGVAVGDLTTARDAQRMARWCDQVVQINTGKGCHLDANQVRQALTRLNLAQIDVLVIENVGNLICPVGFDLGQDVKVGMFSISEGDDKPAKHPYLVQEASVLLLNKIDLQPYVPFDLKRFREDVKRLNPHVAVLELSAHQGVIDPWIDWLVGAVTNRVATATSE